MPYGYATLSLYPRSQGESLQEWQIEHGTRLIYHVTDRERYYYRGAYMDCVRGIDFLHRRTEIDTSRIGVWGSSQGGGLTLATAALDHRVSAAVAGVPWLCNFPVAAEVTTAKARVAQSRGVAKGQIRELYARYLATRAVMDSLAPTAALATRAVSLATRGYELGENDLASVLLVRREAIESEQALLDAQHAHATVKIELLIVTGRVPQ